MLEVRCCCNPDNLYGYLPEGINPGYGRFVTKDNRIISLPKAIYNEDGERRLAYRADRLPLEDLKSIPEFLEAKRKKRKSPKRRTWEK